MTPDRGQPVRILLADDQPDIAKALRLLLKPEGYEMVAVSSPDRAVETLKGGEFDVALIDMNYTRDTTSGREGLDLLTRLGAVEGCPPIVVMTAWGSIDLAVEAMRRGARDFIPKPWENERLLVVLRTQVELGRALRRSQRLEAENVALRDQAAGTPDLVAESAAMRPVVQMIQRVGPSDAAVLVTGENGTGKGLIARALHAASARAGQPLITVNAGGLAESVFESELFGHVRARSPTPGPTGSGGSSWRTAGRSFSTRSATSRPRSRASCSAFWRPVSSSGSGPRSPGGRTPVSSPRPMLI